MLFNSLDFAIFLPIVFILYWFVTNNSLKLQNCLIVIASYLFYAWWDWRFLSLIVVSTTIDYWVGQRLKRENRSTNRKWWLYLSILTNIGLLGFFKYYNFFLDNFITAFSFFGREISANSLTIILPVGISFYTFQTLSYTIDVYRRKLEPTKDFIAFAAFVSFFPQLVAGPIERATHLLPQFQNKRSFNDAQAADGLRQILWGLFKKVVIADNCAEYANLIFNNSADYSGATLVLGALLFTFQIYGDFSGYSDIAIGVSRLFGVDLRQNFNFPYFSRNIAEFWRRWHISLSTWFRDYLYIPLGGSRGNTFIQVRNVFIIFLVSGFWHGANWTFIVWGFLHALYFLPLLLLGKNRQYLNTVAEGKHFPNVKEILSIFSTFALTVFAWIFFRAEDIGHAFQYIKSLVIGLFSETAYMEAADLLITKIGFILPSFILAFLIIEWIGRNGRYALERLMLNWKPVFRYGVYYAIIFAIIWFGGKQQEFIYFQF